MFGIWGRLPPGALDQPAPRDRFPHFTAIANFPGNGRSIWIARSTKHAFAFQTARGDKTLRVGTQIFLGGPAEAGVISGWHFKGALCDPDDPPALYRWSFSEGRVIARARGEKIHATYLSLEPLTEPCEERRRLLAGVWEGLD